jgi:hypothetical protein
MQGPLQIRTGNGARGAGAMGRELTCGSDRKAAETIGSGRRWICEALDWSARGRRKGWGGGCELEAERRGVIGRGVCA